MDVFLFSYFTILISKDIEGVGDSFVSGDP